jgi:hypothetical protein
MLCFVVKVAAAQPIPCLGGWSMLFRNKNYRISIDPASTSLPNQGLMMFAGGNNLGSLYVFVDCIVFGAAALHF